MKESSARNLSLFLLVLMIEIDHFSGSEYRMDGSEDICKRPLRWERREDIALEPTSASRTID